MIAYESGMLRTLIINRFMSSSFFFSFLQLYISLLTNMANPSNSFQFPGMRNLSNATQNNMNASELRWHGAIDSRWPTLNQAQRK